MIKFRSLLKEANSAPLTEKQRKSMDLSVAANETEARNSHYNPASLEAVALRNSGYVPAGIANDLKRGAAKLDKEDNVVHIDTPDAPHSDTYQIPDVEPEVTRNESAEAESEEKVAA